MGISTHILDTERGRPVAGLAVTLEVHQRGAWEEVHAAQTDGDGRCKEVLPAGTELMAAAYRIRFRTAEYYAALGMEGLYPWVEITFSVRDAGQHYHIPLLLTANGYTTYRGS